MRKTAEKVIAVSAFKPRSLAVIAEVASRRTSRVVLTRRGKPVAAIVPVDPEPLDDLWGAMRGSVKIPSGVDITEPIGEDWDADRDK